MSRTLSTWIPGVDLSAECDLCEKTAGIIAKPAREWREQWPPLTGDASDDALPRAVEIKLITTDWGEVTRVYALPG